MNIKSILFAVIVALGITSFADTASAGHRYRGRAYYGGYSRAYVRPYYRSYAPIRSYYYNGCAPRYYNCAPRYYYPSCHSGYYGYPGYYGGVALRVGPVVFGSGSSGYYRY